MSDFLFAYGTLQPGLAPAEIAPTVSKLLQVGEAFIHGLLYDLGGHPGAVLDSASQERIIGSIYQLPDDPTVLAQLDAYEEFDPAEPESSLYLRVLHPVNLATRRHAPMLDLCLQSRSRFRARHSWRQIPEM